MKKKLGRIFPKLMFALWLVVEFIYLLYWLILVLVNTTHQQWAIDASSLYSEIFFWRFFGSLSPLILFFGFPILGLILSLINLFVGKKGRLVSFLIFVISLIVLIVTSVIFINGLSDF